MRTTLTRLRTNNAGSALVMAVAFSAVFTIAGMGTMQLIRRGNDLHTRDLSVMKSYWANEAGIKLALRYLTRDSSNVTNAEPTDEEENASLSINGYTPAITIADAGTEKNIVVTTAAAGGLRNKTTIESQAEQMSYGRYGWFADDNTGGGMSGAYGEESCPWTDMIIHGDAHTNGVVYVGNTMSPKPHVTGRFTTSSQYSQSDSGMGGGDDYPAPFDRGISVQDWSLNSSSDDDAKRAWLETRFPDYNQISSDINTDGLEPQSISGGLPINNGGYDNVRIQFRGDGTVALMGCNGAVDPHDTTDPGWTTFASYTTNEIRTNHGGIIRHNDDLYVDGEVNGQVTVVSHKDIHIYDDITYSDVPPGEQPDPVHDDDILALVAADGSGDRQGVLLMQRAFKNNGGSPMNVYASVFAKNGGLMPEDFWNEGSHVDMKHNPWNIHGSGNRVIEDQRYDLNLFGSALVGKWWENADEGALTYQGGQDNNFPPSWVYKMGFKTEIWTDARYIEGGINPPGIPTMENTQVDQEIVDYWTSVTDQQMTPITISGPWENTVER